MVSDEQVIKAGSTYGSGALASSMFEDRNSARAFFSAPRSVTEVIAALLEPAVIVGVFLASTLWRHGAVGTQDIVLCLLVFALAFPGRNRFKLSKLSAAVDIVTGWAALLIILALCGYATDSLSHFDVDTLTLWAVVTPVVQWCAATVGGGVVKVLARRPEARRPAIVLGASALGVRVANAIKMNHDQGSDFFGYFDDRLDSRVHPEAQRHIRGGFQEVAKFIDDHGIKEVYITLPLGSQPRIVKLLEALQGTTASLFFVPDVFGISIIQGRLQDLHGLPVVGICETPFTGVNAFLKRISDLVLASIIVMLISPVLLAVAIGVKMSSPGPVIFKQRRNGLDGEEIVVYKFRSMTTMDNGPEIKQATKDDPRITAFGRFIRSTSLDELPQFFNVLQGRMSIVGPRPHAVAHNDEYRKLIKAYMVRHKVKPGITGWAQVNGHRGETDTLDKMQARVEYDLEYLRNWSLGLDLQIIARTVKLMLLDRHAY